MGTAIFYTGTNLAPAPGDPYTSEGNCVLLNEYYRSAEIVGAGYACIAYNSTECTGPLIQRIDPINNDFLFGVSSVRCC